MPEFVAPKFRANRFVNAAAVPELAGAAGVAPMLVAAGNAAVVFVEAAPHALPAAKSPTAAARVEVQSRERRPQMDTDGHR